MPSRAKIRMKRNSRNRSETIERILLSNDITRFRSDDQYLKTRFIIIIIIIIRIGIYHYKKAQLTLRLALDSAATC